MPLRATRSDGADHPGFQTRRRQKGDDLIVELRVSIQDDVTVWASFWKGLAQLLDDPLRRRVSCDVAVQDLAASVLDDEKAVE